MQKQIQSANLKPANTGTNKEMIATGTIRRASLSTSPRDGQID
ncbi:hypothetical protein [Leptospira meyeri]|nr:hypothetical protein [Leptospira meyeri]